MFSKYVVSAALVIVGVIHLLPLSGVLGAERLTVLYGLPFDDPNISILMQHRAVMFGLMGLFFVFAAFRQSLQVLALVGGYVSVVAFLVLAQSVGDYNEAIARVFWADVVALVGLVIGTVAHGLRRRVDG